MLLIAVALMVGLVAADLLDLTRRGTATRRAFDDAPTTLPGAVPTSWLK
jgi:hypothetical protein